MTFAQNSLDNKAFVSLNLVVFTSNGTYTPPNNLLAAQVICVGGGGGAGGRSNTAVAGGTPTESFGGGGGGGGTAIKVFSLSDLLPNVNVTVGDGGSAGSSGLNPGGNGGDTIFATSTPLVGNGGAGGTSSAAESGSPSDFGLDIVGAAGGSASGGDLNIPGGSCGFTTAGGAGSPGSSLLSPPAGAAGRNTSSARQGLIYGGGAGTAWNTSQYGQGTQSAKPGAEGGAGVVIIYEYLGVAP